MLDPTWGERPDADDDVDAVLPMDALGSVRRGASEACASVPVGDARESGERILGHPPSPATVRPSPDAGRGMSPWREGMSRTPSP